MNRRISIAIFVASCSTIACADDYKREAYCVGGLRRNIEDTDRGYKAQEFHLEGQNPVRDLTLQLSVHETKIKHAIERGELDHATFARLNRTGYDDQKACDDGIDKCWIDLSARASQNIGREENSRMCLRFASLIH
jgi:hypothetical protein